MAKACLSCGLCCRSPIAQEAFCDVTERDVRRMGRARRLVLGFSAFDRLCSMMDGRPLPFGVIATKRVRQTKGPHKGKTFHVCAALRGNIGHAVRCSIYPNRPETCRTAVIPGDRTCKRLRKTTEDE
jgi:Fe-S-cluster containining protein